MESASRKVDVVESPSPQVDVIESSPTKVDVVVPQQCTRDVVDSQPVNTTAITPDASNSARIAAIQREYIQMDVKKLWHIKTMPAADNEDSGEFTTALITSIRRTVRNILQLADATGTQSFDDDDWVDGWQTPLHKALHRAINRRSPTTAASLTQILDGFCSAMESDSAHGSRGPEVLVVWRGGYPDSSIHPRRQVPFSVSVLLAWPLMFLSRTTSDSSSW